MTLYILSADDYKFAKYVNKKPIDKTEIIEKYMDLYMTKQIYVVDEDNIKQEYCCETSK